MRRYFALCFILSALLYAGCTQEYEPPVGPTPPDTVKVTDTLTVIDTVYVDTSHVDTVYVDTSGCTPSVVCGTICGSVKTFTVPLANVAGTYQVTVTVEADRDKPEQSVSICINDQPVATVSVVPSPALWSGTFALPPRAVISVAPNIPPAAGHPLHVCMTIERI